jgi:methyl-accepting chemotaxis protein
LPALTDENPTQVLPKVKPYVTKLLNGTFELTTNMNFQLQKLSLQQKLQILIQGFMLLVLLAAQYWVSNQIERRAIHAAKDRSAMVADGVINALNILMSAKVNGKDVYDDPKIRDMFIQKMGESNEIKELRVVCGKGVIDEFGPGLPNQQPVEHLDREVLMRGKSL